MNAKIKLEHLKVNSFVVSLKEKPLLKIQGGCKGIQFDPDASAVCSQCC